MEPWLGDGLASFEGDQWRMRRKLITPSFHFKILEQFVNTFESCGDALIKNLSKMNGNQSLDIFPYLNRCSLDIVCETAMGTKTDVQSNESSRYFQSAKEMCTICMRRVTSAMRRYNFFFRLTKDYYRQNKLLKFLHGDTDNVIDSKLTKLKKIQSEQNQNENQESNMVVKNRKLAFLDMLLESVLREEIALKDVRSEVNLFMFAGHDTISTGASFVLYCIANHRSVQDKLLREQKEIFGDVKNPKVTYADLQKMRYLECVVKEGLRLYSPVPLLGRETREEVNYNGLTMPEGVIIYVYVRAIHMNPKYYPDPEKFDPGRFEGTPDIDVDQKPQHSFLLFGTGVRNCIGQKYAMLEIKSIISKVIRNFELSPAEPAYQMDLATEMVLRSLNGVKIGIKLR